MYITSDRDEMINHICECSTQTQKDKTQLSGQGNPLGNVPEIEIWSYEQMVCAEPRICSGEWDTQTPLGFWDKTDHLISARRPQQENQNLPNSGLCFPGGPQRKIERKRKKKKKRKKKDTNLDLARELKKLWNMNVAVIPNIIGALGTVTKWLVQKLEDLEIRGKGETIQTTTLLWLARILRTVLENWGDLLTLTLQ